MTRVFVYEFVTGGGFLGECVPHGSLLAEGAAMRAALAADFAAVEGVVVTTLHDGRLPRALPEGCEPVEVGSPGEERRAFERLAAACDWTVLIAPESDRHLLTRCKAATAAGGRLLSPGAEFVALAADKQRTAEQMSAAGVPVPRGVACDARNALPRDFPYPAVVKPRSGAGSQDVRLVAAPGDFVPAGPARMEAYCPGTPASVAVLCGGDHICVLPPVKQRLSRDGRFRYLGGALPLSEPRRGRADELARRVVAALPPALGYVGIDLVLGESPDGRDDVVIEVNPRLTTSYVGLRAAAAANLAEAMLQLAAGGRCHVAFRDEPLEFDADGCVYSTRNRARKAAPGGAPAARQSTEGAFPDAER